jgi:toxin ParE1/3/4
MRVRYTSRALGDLAAISDYLIDRNPVAVEKFGESVSTTVSLLREFPACGRALQDRASVRVMPLGKYPYLIFYTIAGEELRILHVRHGARRPVQPHDL